MRISYNKISYKHKRTREDFFPSLASISVFLSHALQVHIRQSHKLHLVSGFRIRLPRTNTSYDLHQYGCDNSLLQTALGIVFKSCLSSNVTDT